MCSREEKTDQLVEWKTSTLRFSREVNDMALSASMNNRVEGLRRFNMVGVQSGQMSFNLEWARPRDYTRQFWDFERVSKWKLFNNWRVRKCGEWKIMNFFQVYARSWGLEMMRAILCNSEFRKVYQIGKFKSLARRNHIVSTFHHVARSRNATISSSFQTFEEPGLSLKIHS